MDSPSGKSITKIADADSRMSPFEMLASKCEVMECSSIMLMGAHNRCSFQVTLKVHNKRFIASGPTILSAKKKASLAALRQLHNEGGTIMKSSASKSLDFGEASLETGILANNSSSSGMQELVNAAPQDDYSNDDTVSNSNDSLTIDINGISDNGVSYKTLVPQNATTTSETADHFKNDETAKVSTIELDLSNKSDDSSLHSGEAILRISPTMPSLENIEDSELGEKFTNIASAELIKSNVILLTTDESNDSMTSAVKANHVKYISVQNGDGNFQHEEVVVIVESPPGTVLKRERITDELQNDAYLGIEADAAVGLKEFRSTASPMEIVQAMQNGKANKPVHVLDCVQENEDPLPNHKGNSLDVKENSLMVTEMYKSAIKTIENEINQLSIFEPNSNRYDSLLSDAQLNQQSIEDLSANTTYSDEASISQDCLREAKHNNSGCNTVQENISFNLKQAGSPSVVQELFETRSLLILNIENSIEFDQETENSTKTKEHVNDANKNDLKTEMENSKEYSCTNEISTVPHQNILNAKVSSNAKGNILKEYKKFCTIIETDNELSKSVDEEEVINPILNFKEIFRVSPLKDTSFIEQYPLDISVPFSKNYTNNDIVSEIEKEVYSSNVEEANQIGIENKIIVGSTEDKTIQYSHGGEICEPETNSVVLSEEYNSQMNLEIKMDSPIAMSLKETDFKISETTISNVAVKKETNNLKGKLENTIPIIGEVIPKEKFASNVVYLKETDLKIYENSTVQKTDREIISNLKTDKVVDITKVLQENTTTVTDEAISEGTSLHNYKVCTMASHLTQRLANTTICNDCDVSTFAEMNKDCDFYQINESIIIPVSDLANPEDLPKTNEDTVPNPFAKKQNVEKIANKSSVKKKPLKKINKNVTNAKTKLNIGDMPVKIDVQSNTATNKAIKKCVLNPIVKKIQNANTANNKETVTANNVQNDIAVVDLVEEEEAGGKGSVAFKPTTNTLNLKRKVKETVLNPASKRIKLSVLSHTNEASLAQVPSTVTQLDEGTDSNDENSHSISSGSSVEFIPTPIETIDVDLSSNREQTIEECLSILLNDDERMSCELLVPSIVESPGPVVVIQTAKKGNLKPKCLNKNPIALIDDVLEVPITSTTKTQTPQFPITPKTRPPTSQFKKPKTADKLMPKIKTKSPNIKTKSPNIKTKCHPYKQRQRYLQELATKRKISRVNKANETANPIERLKALRPDVSYQLESEMGPSHAPFFILSANINGRCFYGHGKTRHLARLDAAVQILDTLDYGSTPKIQPISSNHTEEQPTCSKRINEGVDKSKNDQNHSQQFDDFVNHTVNDNNIELPHSSSDNNHRRYVAPLPPRDKRIANVLPNKRQYIDRYSHNRGGRRFPQYHRVKMQRGTQGYNFDNAASSVPFNFHFAGQSANQNVYSNHPGTSSSQYHFHRHVTPNYFENIRGPPCPQFNFPNPHYILANILNGMPNIHQFSGHYPNDQHFNNRFDYDTHGREPQRRVTHFARKNRKSDNCAFRYPYNAEANDEPMLTSNNQNQVNISVENAASQPTQPPRPRSQCMNPEPPTFHFPNIFPKNLLLPQQDSDIIEKLILERFEQLTRSRPEVSNYKVLAGIVMTRHLNFQNAKVIAVATGTKCINGGNISSDGTVINDSHAEVIARRCLMKFLYTQIKYHGHPDNVKESIFVRNPTGFKYAFTLKPQVQFHLYISTAPCGDARIFSSNEDHTNQFIVDEPNHGQLRTKVEGGMGTKRIGNQYLHQAWDGIQIGDPLHTMSCSDKIARWNVVGVQGGLLATLAEPVYLSSIVLGSMFNARHLYRAVCGRLEQTLNLLPEPFRLNRPLLGQTSNTRMLRSTDRIPCIGVNWTFGDQDIEIISLPGGREITNKLSYICKKVFFQKFVSLVQNIPDLDITQMPNIYAEVKLIAGDFQKAKQELFDAFQHAELGCWVKKPVEQNEFAVYFSR